jgi:hypothetical protein
VIVIASSIRLRSMDLVCVRGGEAKRKVDAPEFSMVALTDQVAPGCWHWQLILCGTSGEIEERQ